MLILSRYRQQSIMIGKDIEITILSVDRIDGRVRVAINAPNDVEVHRKEIFLKIEEGGKNVQK